MEVCRVRSLILALAMLLLSPPMVWAQGVNLGQPSSTPVEPTPVGSIPDGSTIAPTENAPGGSSLSNGSFATRTLELVQSLSYFAIPFAIASLLAIWFTVERVVVLRRGRVIPKPFVQRFLKLIEEGELNKDEALQVCDENGSPIAMVFAHGVRKWGKSSVEVEQAMIDGGERQVAALRKHLRVINGVATITPLLGLLGTVWGMLESFSKIASAGAMGRTDELASGIALALVTTAAGLLIAIPCLVVYMYLSGKVDSLVMEMDDLAMQVVQNISAEGIAERNSRPKRTKDSGDSGQKKA
ncbi:MotA/TolQ/ExbB proton channel family protein [Planctomicrobium sp. SH661]|uniref:MotA/TolQ/ExbB proton channel family protein n=1 Tax=Planctomicrobium sp. SH661 TaxID=3448124 RepID=UPI003F5BC196